VLHKSPRELMAILALFAMQILKRKFPQPPEAVVEKVYFKQNSRKFVSQYTASQPNELRLYAIRIEDGKSFYLGKYVDGKLIAPPYDELVKLGDWSSIKGARRLYNWLENGKKYANAKEGISY